MVYSQQTAWFYGGEQAARRSRTTELGWYQALIEARIPFEMVHDRLLDAEHLSQFKTLILPNIAALSDAQCAAAARSSCERGGSLVATFETSLYDEWGVRRKDFGLADLFGRAMSGGPVEGPMQNSYLTLENDAPRAVPSDSGRAWKTRARIINGVCAGRRRAARAVAAIHR